MDPTRRRGSNTLMDESVYLKIFDEDEAYSNLRDLLPEDAPELTEEQIFSETEDIEGLTAKEEVETFEYDPVDNPGDVKYSSYLARRLIIHTEKCDVCVNSFSVDKNGRGEQHRILGKIENKDNAYELVASQLSLQNFTHRASSRFKTVLRENYTSKKLGSSLALAISKTEGFHPVFDACPLHSETNKKFFIKKMVSSLMRLELRQQNHILQDFLKKSRGKAKVASLATSGKDLPKLFLEEKKGNEVIKEYVTS
jgi:hypothetical protein